MPSMASKAESLMKYMSEGPQNEIVVGSQSYFKNMTLRDNPPELLESPNDPKSLANTSSNGSMPSGIATRGSAATSGSQPSSFMAARSLNKPSSLQGTSIKKGSSGSSGKTTYMNKHLMASNLGAKSSVLDVVPEFPERAND